MRWHEDQSDVQRVISFPLHSINRKKLLADLRKRGNLIHSMNKET